MKSVVKKLGLGLGASAAICLGPTAQAQTTSQPQPPDAMVVSPAGVDLRSGQYSYKKTDLSIGTPENGGIELSRGPKTTSPRGYQDQFGKFSGNWDIHLDITNPGPTEYKTVSATIQGLSYTFTASPDYSAITLLSQTGFAKLVNTSPGSLTSFRLTEADGTIVDFTDNFATSLLKPNGIKYTLTYDAAGLRRVESNTGYALLLQHSGATPSPVIAACVVNLAFTGPVTSCPAGAMSVSYTYSTNQISMVDASGSTWTYGTTSSGLDPYSDTYFKPGYAQPYLIVDYDHMDWTAYVTKQTFADAHFINYSWTGETYACPYGQPDCNDKSFPLGSGFSDNGTATTQVTFYVGPVSPVTRVSPGPTSVTDPLNRSHSFSYCDGVCPGYSVLKSATKPSGETVTIARDGYRNVVKETRSAATGSSLGPTEKSWTYSNCSAFSNLIACSSPTSFTDAKLNTADYTYDPTHGGILTETAPAVGGIRPVKRYSYVQRYAWIKAGSGYVHASAPVWLVSSVKTCRATTTVSGTCAGGAADEITTTMEYGPDSGPNNLLVRGNVVTADGTSRRTCYGYDSQGNRISETSPLGTAALTSCP